MPEMSLETLQALNAIQVELETDPLDPNGRAPDEMLLGLDIAMAMKNYGIPYETACAIVSRSTLDCPPSGYDAAAPIWLQTIDKIAVYHSNLYKLYHNVFGPIGSLPFINDLRFTMEIP